MGRGHESEVRVCDISVSRCHALVKYKDGQYFLEDNLSKFGTLVIPQKEMITLEPEKTKAVQIGRSVISFTIKKCEKEEGPIQPVLKPRFVAEAEQESSEAEIDLVEEELKKKIEITNDKIQALMKSQADQLQLLV